MSDDPLPLFHVSSAAVGGAEALRLFQDSVRDVFTAEPDGVDPEAEPLTMCAAHLGGVLYGEVRAYAMRFRRDRALVATGGVAHLMVQLYPEGGFEGLAGEAAMRVRPGDIGVLDLADTLDTRAPRYRNLTLVIPRALLGDRLADTAALHGRVLRREQPRTRVLANHLETLWSEVPGLTLREADALGRATVAMIADLLERELGEAAAGPRPQGEEPPRRRVLRYIDARLGDPDLDADALAERFGMSRAALYRLFQPVGGVASLIRERRLRGAALELASEAGHARKVSEVARRWGFTDDAAFGRAFRQQYGVTPSAARREAGRVWARAQLGGPGGLEGAELAWWFRTLRG